MRIQITIWLCLLVIGLSVSTSSCEREASFIVAEYKIHIDSMARNEIKALQSTIDSLCKERFDAGVQKAVDSLIVLRKQEIEAIRNRKVRNNE